MPPLLMAGLRRLEYRGYDSAGMAVINACGKIERRRMPGKIVVLAELLENDPMHGSLGIAHTRWATHGAPCLGNTHPITSHDEIALVHNGIIENFVSLRADLMQAGYTFTTDTDTEAIAHLLHQECSGANDMLAAVQRAAERLEGSYALAVLHAHWPDRIICICRGCPLVLGVGIGESFIASDVNALYAVTDRYIFLHDGDAAIVRASEQIIYDDHNTRVARSISPVTHVPLQSDRGMYRHFIEKEIFEQPQSVAATMEGRIGKDHVLEEAFGPAIATTLSQIDKVTMVGCGSSFYAGCVGRYWLEGLGGVQCNVEIASEYRYRDAVVLDNALFIALSQSGETADTIAALRTAVAMDPGYGGTLAICNSDMSTLSRLAKMLIPMSAGPEVSVASTKAVTSQLVILLLLSLLIGRRRGLSRRDEATLIAALYQLPDRIADVLNLDREVQRMALEITSYDRALFLGRGSQYPVALEGALKLKELSYMHAEAYPAGELKHGPLAIVDSRAAIVALAPDDNLLEKLVSNLQEVGARGGALYVFADQNVVLDGLPDARVIRLPKIHKTLAPILYLLPLQLLAYHTALFLGTDVDQPRNLAKSVTVE